MKCPICGKLIQLNEDYFIIRSYEYRAWMGQIEVIVTMVLHKRCINRLVFTIQKEGNPTTKVKTRK
jgi:hypothetical protein